MIILGADPGYGRFGIAVVEKTGRGEVLLFSDCISTDKGQDLGQRLLTIGADFEKVIAKYKPSAMVIEKLFFTANQKTAMGVAEARGVASYLAAKHSLAIYELTPLQIKTTITGYGAASKRQVKEMVGKLVAIEKPIRHDDEYDAIAVALVGAVIIHS